MKVRLLVIAGLMIGAFSSPILGMEDIFAQLFQKEATLNQFLEDASKKVGYKKTAKDLSNDLQPFGITAKEIVSIVNELGATKLYNRLYNMQIDFQKDCNAGRATKFTAADYSTLSYYRLYLAQLGKVVNFRNLKNALTALDPVFKNDLRFDAVWSHGFFLNDRVNGQLYNQKIYTILTQAPNHVFDANPELLKQFNAISAKYNFAKELVKQGDAYTLIDRNIPATYTLEYLLDVDTRKIVTLDMLIDKNKNGQGVEFPLEGITLASLKEQMARLNSCGQNVNDVYRFLENIVEKHDVAQPAPVNLPGPVHGSLLPQAPNDPLIVHGTWRVVLSKNSLLENSDLIKEAKILFNVLKKVAKIPAGVAADEMEQRKDTVARQQLANQLNELSAQSMYDDITHGITNRDALSPEAKQLIKFLENSGNIRRWLVDMPGASLPIDPQVSVQPPVVPQPPLLPPLHNDITILLQKMGIEIDNFDAVLLSHGLTNEHIELIHEHGLFDDAELQGIDQAILEEYRKTLSGPDEDHAEPQPDNHVVSKISPLLIAGSIVGGCLLVIGAGLGIYALIKAIRVKKIKEQCKHIASVIALVEKGTISAQEYRTLSAKFSLPHKINRTVEKALEQNDYEKALTVLRAQEKKIQELSKKNISTRIARMLRK